MKHCKLHKCIDGRALVKGKWRKCLNCQFEKQKHTNLDHEITGAYYEDKNTLADYLIYAGLFLVAVAIFDLFFPEVVTSVGVYLLELFR